MLEGWIEGAPEPRTQSAWESTAKPEIERGEGSGEEARWAPSLENNLKIHTGNHELEYSWSENLNFRPADLGIFRRFSNDFDTFQSSAYI